MIRVEVRYILKDGMLKSFYGEILSQKIDSAARAENGNLKYDFEIPKEKDVLLLHELWEKQSALDKHANMPHYKALAALKAEYVEQTLIEKTEV